MPVYPTTLGHLYLHIHTRVPRGNVDRESQYDILSSDNIYCPMIKCREHRATRQTVGTVLFVWLESRL